MTEILKVENLSKLFKQKQRITGVKISTLIYIKVNVLVLLVNLAVVNLQLLN